MSVPAPNMEPALINSPLFSAMSESEFNDVTSFMERSHFKAGERIFDEGDHGENMFILVSGSLGAQKRQSDGTQRWMFDIKPGAFFGEMSIVMDEPRSATIAAKDDSDLMVLQSRDFYRLIFEHPAIGIKMLTSMGAVQNGWLNDNSSYLRDLVLWGETARRRAITDELTGLYNRSFLEESINERFKSGAVKARKMSLIMMDLDKVHAINNTYGPAGGDKVIIAAANVIKDASRSADIAARLSGDEFSVLLPDTSSQDAAVLAEKIRKNVSLQTVSLKRLDSGETDELHIGTSLGIAVAPDHADNVRDLFFTADEALRKAKDLGRNRVELYG